MRNPAAQGRPDANHAQVGEWYREEWCLTFDTHKLGGGFGDWVIGIPTKRGKVLQIVEVKTPDGSLRPNQVTFLRDWGVGCVAVIQTREDVRAHVHAVREKFK